MSTRNPLEQLGLFAFVGLAVACGGVEGEEYVSNAGITGPSGASGPAGPSGSSGETETCSGLRVKDVFLRDGKYGSASYDVYQTGTSWTDDKYADLGDTVNRDPVWRDRAPSDWPDGVIRSSTPVDKSYPTAHIVGETQRLKAKFRLRGRIPSGCSVSYEFRAKAKYGSYSFQWTGTATGNAGENEITVDFGESSGRYGSAIDNRALQIVYQYRSRASCGAGSVWGEWNPPSADSASNYSRVPLGCKSSHRVFMVKAQPVSPSVAGTDSRLTSKRLNWTTVRARYKRSNLDITRALHRRLSSCFNLNNNTRATPWRVLDGGAADCQTLSFLLKAQTNMMGLTGGDVDYVYATVDDCDPWDGKERQNGNQVLIKDSHGWNNYEAGLRRDGRFFPGGFPRDFEEWDGLGVLQYWYSAGAEQQEYPNGNPAPMPNSCTAP